MKRKIFVNILIFILLSILVNIFSCMPKQKFKLKCDILQSKDDVYQVFYDIGNGFNETDSVKKEVKSSKDFQVIEFLIPSNIKNIKKIRLDIGSNVGNIYIKNIIIEKSFFDKKTYKNSNLSNLVEWTNNIIDIHNENIGELFVSDGIDPFIVFKDDILKVNKFSNFYKFIFSEFISLILLVTLIYSRLYSKMINYFETNMNPIYNILFIFSLIIILFIPWTFNLLNINLKSANYEQRNMAVKPVFSPLLTDFKTFVNDYESYINDNFIFRTKLVRLNNIIMYKLFKTSGTDRVIMGKNGWLFYADENVLNNYRGIDSFTKEELEHIKADLEQRKRWLEQNGIKFYVTVAPNKHTIYYDKLPNYLVKINNESRLDQLINYLNKNSDIRIIDLRPALFKAKVHEKIYYTNDTHWNNLAGYYGYREIIDDIKKDFPGIKPLEKERLVINTQNNAYSGDLSVMLSMPDIIKDDVYDIKIKNSAVKAKQIDANQFPAPERFVYNENMNSDNEFKLLMFRDSFTTALVPYLSENFRNSLYIWDNHFNADIIKREKPDIVVLEVVERSLHNVAFENN